jgi:hypothetical protein
MLYSETITVVLLEQRNEAAEWLNLH